MPLSVKIVGIVAGAVILGVVGWADDKYEEMISPYVRLGINVCAALAVIVVGIGIAYVTNPLGGVIRLDRPQYCFELVGATHCIWILADLFALLWLVWMQNVVGWSSGVDGQLPGFVVIAALTMGVLGMRFGTDANQWSVVVLAGIVAGAYLGFLAWNWYPQKIMPGYGGKSLAGFLLGVLAIMSGAKVGAMMMVLGMPLVDGVLVVVKRLKEKRSPVWGGREHLHHYLLELGWGRRRIAVFYWGIAAVMAVLALRLNSESKYFTMAAIAVVGGGVIVWFHYFSTYLKQQDRGSG
jgi:UDP-GlcNAc:undecaprenyl-phosphate GlcNAc-1-phosphate transferase